jgi:hypothetical protein
VLKESVSLDRIKHELCKRSVCIVLVDANLLKGINLNLNEAASSEAINEMSNHHIEDDFDELDYSRRASSNCCWINPFSNVTDEIEKASRSDFNKLVDLNIIKTSKNNYCGHFVVVIGYDDAKKLVFYRNPGTACNFSYTSYLNFEIARKSFGTDEDILFIYS